MKTLAPELSPLTVALYACVSENVPLPLATVQVPCPTVGLFAARVVLLLQTSWAEPALDVEGELHTTSIQTSPLVSRSEAVVLAARPLPPTVTADGTLPATPVPLFAMSL